MTAYEGIYRCIKELIPDTLPVTFSNLDENKENCGIAFKGTTGNSFRSLSGEYNNRCLNVVFNYNVKDVFKGFEYGEAVVETLTGVNNIAYRDDNTGEMIVYISNIRLMGNINYLGKNKNNALNAFSINFNITYGLL